MKRVHGRYDVLLPGLEHARQEHREVGLGLQCRHESDEARDAIRALGRAKRQQASNVTARVPLAHATATCDGDMRR